MTTDVRMTTEWSNELGGQLPLTVARVDLRPTTPLGAGGSPEAGAAHEMALRSIQRTVRADDRICPYGLSRIAVAFGADAEAVTPRRLGERLARAVGQGATANRRSHEGRDPRMDGTGPHPEVANGRSTNPRQDPMTTIPSVMVVTVDRLLGTGGLPVDARVRTLISSIEGSMPFNRYVAAPLLRHRTVVRYSTCRLAGYGTRHDDNFPEPGEPRAGGTVLMIDPGRPVNGTASLSTEAASSMAHRLGFTSAAIPLTADDNLILDIGGTPVDLVVLVVGGEPATDQTGWSSSTWSVPARLAGAYHSLGVDVLAVSAGAGAAALAACVEQGAMIALSDIDDLPSELHSLLGDTGQRGATKEELRRMPARFEALMQLTASERRVLFFLTRGRSAQDIAVELVVSLATVRSHIRSILRKLGVRSQLAAVAIANSRDLDHVAADASL
jgi:DNA-binding CsgD family transcriptional regulator